MRTVKACITCVMLAVVLGAMANAMPLNSSARSVIPAELQQLISVDYRALKDSSTAMQLKQQLMPDNIKEFETALKGVGMNRKRNGAPRQLPDFARRKAGLKPGEGAAGPLPVKTC